MCEPCMAHQQFAPKIGWNEMFNYLLTEVIYKYEDKLLDLFFLITACFSVSFHYKIFLIINFHFVNIIHSCSLIGSISDNISIK